MSYLVAGYAAAVILIGGYSLYLWRESRAVLRSGRTSARMRAVKPQTTDPFQGK